MDNIPTEILLNIFTHLPQRFAITVCSIICKQWNKVINLPSFYSTIHIYSDRHMKKIIQLFKERKIMNRNNYTGYYVKRLLFHYKDSSPDTIKDLLVVFPKLQYMDGLEHTYLTASECKSFYLQLQQPTDFTYLYTNEQWVIKLNQINHYLKSLHIYITKELIDFLPQLQQQTETIHIITKGKLNSDEVNESNLTIQIKALILPKAPFFTQLIKLRIDFHCYDRELNFPNPDYVFDQHTFENIHQSCPLLESLSVEKFYMQFSNECYYSNTVTPALHLKNLTVTKGNFCHPSCFQYLLTKYPHLESLSLDLHFNYLLSTDKIHFQNAIINMLRQFSLLKKLNYHHWGDYNDVDPYYELIEYLNQQPNQLTHLDYLFSLTLDAYITMYDIEEDIYYSAIHDYDNNNNNDNHSRWNNNNNNNNNKEYKEDNDNDFISLLHQQQQLQPFDFLSQLTSLSLDFDNAVNLAFKILLKNTNTIIVSTNLQELIIKQGETTSLIYFYDWMDMFPNLLLFKVNLNVYIIDNSDFFNKYNNNEYLYKGGDIISIKLHRLIKKIRQQQQKQQKQIKMLIKEEKDHTLYKLKELELSLGTIWFKNGLDDLLKKCHHLKRLRIYELFFINASNPSNIIYLDLSSLHLELLEMYQLYCSSPKKMDPYNNRIQQFSLNLTCKFIDGLIHSNE
ncbi:unnamed protein product [Cunninghamella blakesleeana]